MFSPCKRFSIMPHKSLLLPVYDSLKVCGIAAIFAFGLLILLPWPLRWCLFYLSGVTILINLIASFINDWRPRSRVTPAGQAVFISGCDSGFGHLLAQRLDDAGLCVFAGCLLPNGAGAERLKASGSRALHVIPLDVTSDESVQNAYGYVKDNLNGKDLWAVVNNAGIAHCGELFWTNMESIKKVFDVNTFGVVRITKAFLPLLCKSKGRVVTVASAAGRTTCPAMVPYCMSKHATVSFCDGLRLEMYRFGIKVVSIEPYSYKTPIADKNNVLKSLNAAWEEAPSEIKEHYPMDYRETFSENVLYYLNSLSSSKPQQVVDCMEEAVMAECPKYSYSPGNLRSRSLMWFGSWLPKPVLDLALHIGFYRR